MTTENLSHPLLILLLFIAARHDYYYYRIPNNIILIGILLGLAVNTLLPGGLGFSGALAGSVFGLFLMLPFYLLRAMGAGDVKLIAMLGAFLGLNGTAGAMLFILLAGGVLALGVTWQRGKLRQLLNNLMLLLVAAPKDKASQSLVIKPIQESAGKLPYGVAIAAGTLVYLIAV